MNEMNVGKWCNEICGRGKQEKNLRRLGFIHHETHIGVTETQNPSETTTVI